MFFLVLNTEEEQLKMERIYYAYRNRLYSVAIEKVKNKNLAEDYVSNTFLIAMENLDKIDEYDDKRTMGYLAIICSRLIYKDHNKNKKLEETFEKMEQGYFENTMKYNPENIYINGETINQLAKSLELIDEISSHIFILRYAEECSRDFISKVTGYSVEAIKKRLSRAKEQLNKNLTGRGI